MKFYGESGEVLADTYLKRSLGGLPIQSECEHMNKLSKAEAEQATPFMADVLGVGAVKFWACLNCTAQIKKQIHLSVGR